MAVNRERKLVDTEVSTLDVNYRTLRDILNEIQDLISSYGADAEIRKCQYDYDAGEYLAVMAKRLEDDSAYSTRIAYEEEWEQRQNARDAIEYERLKAKFG